MPPAVQPSAPPVSGSSGDGASCRRGITTQEIWALTWPQALTMLFHFLIGFTDVAVAGRIDPELQGALGIITQMQFLLQVFAVALVNGGVAAMSQALGARLPLRAERYTGLLFKTGAFFCLLTVGAGWIFAEEMLSLLSVPESIFDLTLELWLLYLPILPASYLGFLTIAVFRAHKKVSIPLVSIIVVCAVNAVADFGFGLGMFGLPNMGARGIILASILSLSAGGIFNLIVLIRSGRLGRNSFASWRWEQKAFPYIAKVAVPAGGSQLLWQLGYLTLFLITNTLPADNAVATSGLTAGMRLEAIIFLPAMAFSFTASILVGHCLGAGNPLEARRVGLRVTGAGVVGMSLLAACMWPFLDEITAFVSPGSVAVQGVAVSYLFYNLLAMPFSVVSMVMSGIFSGAGATVFTMMAFTTGVWLVRLPMAWYMGHIVWQDASGVFIGMLVSQVVQAGICLYLFLYRDWAGFASTAKRFARKPAS